MRLRLIAAATAALLTGPAGARADAVSLIFASASPGDSEISTQFMKPWAERINDEGKGIIHIDYREGFALATTVNSYDRVMADAIQISFMLPGQVAGKFPRTEVVTLPYVSGTNCEASSVALWRLVANGTLAHEYDQLHVLAISQIAQAAPQLAKPLASADNLAGAKLITSSKTLADTVERLGGTPLSIPVNDIYESIVRHVVDGVVIGWATFQPFKLIEVTNYHIDTQLGSGIGVIFMTKAKYDALPADARKILDANSGEAASREYGRVWDRVGEEARTLIRSTPNHQLVELSADQEAAWQKKTAPVVDDWLKATPEGQETLDQFETTLAAVRAGR